jgi:hypothetical protein
VSTLTYSQASKLVVLLILGWLELLHSYRLWAVSLRDFGWFYTFVTLLTCTYVWGISCTDLLRIRLLTGCVPTPC